MDLHIDFEERGDLLAATMRGPLTYDAVLLLFKRILDLSARKKFDKILVDCLALEGDLSVLERYDLGVEASTSLYGLHGRPKIAVVGLPPVISGFAALVARNRGTTVEVFSVREDAQSWLDAAE